MVKEGESDPTDEPSSEDMIVFLGKRAGKMWKAITEYVEDNYEFEPIRESNDLDSTIRYRRSGKTLITFYPKNKELTVLIIFGKNEVEKFQTMRDEFSPEIVELFDTTKQYHDGRWLHIKVPEIENLSDIKKLLNIKKRPKKMV